VLGLDIRALLVEAFEHVAVKPTAVRRALGVQERCDRSQQKPFTLRVTSGHLARPPERLVAMIV
jgi:hypothetical protein